MRNDALKNGSTMPESSQRDLSSKGQRNAIFTQLADKWQRTDRHIIKGISSRNTGFSACSLLQGHIFFVDTINIVSSMFRFLRGTPRDTDWRVLRGVKKAFCTVCRGR